MKYVIGILACLGEFVLFMLLVPGALGVGSSHPMYPFLLIALLVVMGWTFRTTVRSYGANKESK